jgi:hypothetical protein
LAAYWNEQREFEGFWLAIVKRIEPGEYVLEWFDSPEYPAFRSRPQDGIVTSAFFTCQPRQASVGPHEQNQ